MFSEKPVKIINEFHLVFHCFFGLNNTCISSSADLYMVEFYSSGNLHLYTRYYAKATKQENNINNKNNRIKEVAY